MVRTSVLLDEELAARLRHEARRRKLSIAEIVREAVDAHLPRSEPGAPLAFFATGEGREDLADRVDERVGELYEERHAGR